MMLRFSLILTALAACLFVTGCPADACSEGDERCEGEQVQVCDADGAWSDAADCDEGMTCMAMDDGTEHCMAGM